jgi:hypothetical protein
MMPYRDLYHNKQPHEIWWLATLLLWGVAGAISFENIASPSIKALGPFMGIVLYAGLAIWSLVALVGVYWRKNNALGAIIEQVGLTGLSVFGITYAIIILGVAGKAGAGFGVLMGGLSIANLVRVWQIQRYLKLAALARTILPEDVT